jgi:hypothetical protein
VLLAGAARADDPGKAKEAFQRGTTLYDVGQFEKAIEAWQDGYKEKADPAFLYNIAQAYRQLGDASKAIFFYKGYLRNSPKARNRQEVEEKVDALQKQLADQERAKQGGAAGGGGAAAATNPPPASTMPPPVGATGATAAPGSGSTAPPAAATTEPPPGGPSVTVLPTGGAPAATEPAATASAAASGPAPGSESDVVSRRRLSFWGALGADAWSSGVRTKADPSFAFQLGAGYSFGDPYARARFRLGALFGYTFLSESTGTDAFISLMLDPAVEVRLSDSARWYFNADLGLGFLAISGLKANSALLQTGGPPLTVNGTQTLGLVRLGVALEFRATPDLAFFFSPAVTTAKKKDFFYQDITRVELLAGVAYRAF